MKNYTLFLLGASLLTWGIQAELSYKTKMTHKGVEIPVNLTAMPSHDSLRKSSQKVRQRAAPESSGNWAGAAQKAPSSGRFNSISAEWLVPSLYSPGPALTSALYYLGEWVGIDGDSSGCGVILQAGAAQYLSDAGAGYYAWWQWYPNPAFTVTSMPITAGDGFFVNVTATSTTSGIIEIQNLSQDYSFEITLTGGTTLCQQTAEWIVEIPSPYDTYMPAPKFDTTWFEECVATTTTGAVMGIDGATPYYLDSLDGTVIMTEFYDDTDFYVYWTATKYNT